MKKKYKWIPAPETPIETKLTGTLQRLRLSSWWKLNPLVLTSRPSKKRPEEEQK